MRIEVSKEGVRFASEGEAANGSVLLKSTDVPSGGSIKVKKEKTEDDDDPAVSSAEDAWQEARLAMRDKKAAYLKAKAEYEAAIEVERAKFKVYSEARLKE